MRFRKKPVVIDAIKYEGNLRVFSELGVPWDLFEQNDAADLSAKIWNTKEDCWVRCPVGHWIIKGVAGEYYPCDPEVFAATYEPVGGPVLA